MSTITANIAFEQMVVGEFPGTWGTPHTNANWQLADLALAGRVTISLSSADRVITPTEAQNLIINLTGTIVQNINVTWPRGGMFVVNNSTNSAPGSSFNIVVRATGIGKTATVTQGVTALLYSDNTDIWFADTAPQNTVIGLVSAPTIQIDASRGNLFSVTAAQDILFQAPLNPTQGKRIIIRFKASGAGRTATLATGTDGFRFGSDVPSLTLTASSKTDYIGCLYHRIDQCWDVLAYNKGF